jgi:hypothetical protein
MEAATIEERTGVVDSETRFVADPLDAALVWMRDLRLPDRRRAVMVQRDPVVLVAIAASNRRVIFVKEGR